MEKTHVTRAINGEIKKEIGSRKFTLSFSSEEPDEQWSVPEIMDHSPGSADLSRLNSMGVLLFNHNPNQVLGKITRAAIENGRGIAEIEMDTDDFAQTICEKMESGTLKGVSIRAAVKSWEDVQHGQTSVDGRFTGPCSIARKWEAIEISIATIPADKTVGIGRSKNYQQEEDLHKMEKDNITPSIEKATPEQTELTSPVITTEATPIAAPNIERGFQPTVQEASNDALLRSERQRASEINTLCREFGLEPDRYITEGSNIDIVKDSIIKHLRQNKGPVSINIVRDEGDKFRSAASDSLLLRAGIPVKDPAEGSTEFRNMRLRDLMNVCARNEGIANPERMDPDDLMRQFFTPSAAFPAILDNAMNKSYVAGYQSYPSTHEMWTTRGTLSDFRPTKSYTLGRAGELLFVPEGGEIKHDKLSDYARPERQLKTYGRQFTLTREAIYNDDIGLVTTLPQRYAASSRRTVNRQVYSILSGNPIIYDGIALFDAAHNNLVTPGTVPSLKTLQEALNMLALMTDEEDQMIYAVPRYIIVPIGLGDTFRQLIASVTINIQNGGSVTSTSNPLYGRGLEVIEDPTLNTGNTNGGIEWYVAADKTSIPTIQVDYLNGTEIPTIRRMEYPGQLGYIWDVILDWGITVLDYRGIIKNNGSAV